MRDNLGFFFLGLTFSQKAKYFLRLVVVLFSVKLVCE